MTMKKSTVLVLALMLIVSLFALGPAAAQDPTPAPTATFVPSTEGTLTIWTDQNRLAAVESIGQRFFEEFGVPIRVQVMGFGDIRNNLVLGGPVGSGPDLILGAHDWIGQLYSNGLLSPIALPASLVESFDPVGLRAFSYEGKQYGIPIAMEAIALYYNTDLVPEPPATWAEAVELAESLVAEGKAERGIAIPTDPYHTYPLFTGFGGYVFGTNADGSYNPNDVGLDTAGGIAAVEELDRLVKADVFNAAVNYDTGRSLFQEGKLAMWITGPWELGNMRSSGIAYGVAPIPTMDGTPRPFIGAQGFMINAFSKNTLLAESFLLDFVATDEAMKLLYEADPRTPAWLPLTAELTAADTQEAADIKAFAASAGNGEPMPAIPQMSAVWTAWGNAVNLVYQQQGDPEAIIKEAAQAIRDEIAKGSGA
jgi:maltose-binding protein MalE